MAALNTLAMMQLDKLSDIEKAKIKILKKNSTETDKEIEVLFNPSQYTLSDSPLYSDDKNNAKSRVRRQMYNGGYSSTLNMELFFDTGPVMNASGMNNKAATDVSEEVSKFQKLVNIERGMDSPPIVKFIWGSLSFTGIVTQLTSTFTKFTESGMPIQAKLSLSLQACDEHGQKGCKSTFVSPDSTKCETIKEGCSIWDMAISMYGDVAKWKAIARANNISNPLEISPGTIIKIPAL